MTQEEEAVIVSFIVNKARTYQPVNRMMIEERILALLKLRNQTNRSKKGGRKFKKLSPAGRRAELMNPKFCIRIVSDMYQGDKIGTKLGQCVFGAIVGR